MVTGRRPFEHANPDAAVIQKVLSGNRPDRPIVGFSDPLWALLTQMWVEEWESLPPARPNITVVLEQLQDEAKAWSPTNGLPVSETPVEERLSRMSTSSEPSRALQVPLKILTQVNRQKWITLFPYSRVRAALGDSRIWNVIKPRNVQISSMRFGIP